ncbi:MAG: hypothetical protein R2855_04735 [Thermomicrobiales bacterium]
MVNNLGDRQGLRRRPLIENIEVGEMMDARGQLPLVIYHSHLDRGVGFFH